MSYRVILANTAIQDLHEIGFYIAEQSQSGEIAQRFVDELLDRCDRLNDFPQLGALPKDYALRAMDYRFVPYKSYLIFYTVDNDAKAVHIISIINSKKDYRRVMYQFL